MTDSPTISVSEIGEFIRFRSCERRLKLGYGNRAEAKRLPFSERFFNPLDPVLQAMGQEQEDAWHGSLIDAGYEDVSGTAENGGVETHWEDFVASVRELQDHERLLARELILVGQVGIFSVEGRADFALLHWQDDTPKIRIVECKDSRRDRTYHRIQAATYAALVMDLLEDQTIECCGAQITRSDVDAVVARVDEETNERQEILELEPFHLENELTDVETLLRAGGRFETVVGADLDSLEYELNQKCDTCVFNTDCFPESALHRRLELLGLSVPACRTLREVGIATIDDLAELDLDGPIAEALKSRDEIEDSLPLIVLRAETRRATLPDGDGYRVQAIRGGPQSQLPAHETAGVRLVRVYLEVNYDYVEGRVGAIAAHVTNSMGEISTPFEERNDGLRPRPGVFEKTEDGEIVDVVGTGRNIVQVKTEPWRREQTEDTQAEAHLIEAFFQQLIGAIREVADTNIAPVHFYVFHQSEMKQLVEACARTGSRVLSALNQLLGCREPLDQLIFSVIQDEIDSRYALGWTGRGLGVICSLPFFGEVFHWKRIIDGNEIDLDRVFEQDVFDYVSTLDTNDAGEWAMAPDDAALTHRYEIRSRFSDTLPVPYWHAAWGTLPEPDTVQNRRTRGAIERYLRCENLELLLAYLQSRVLALRWLEEKVAFKNDFIRKPSLNLEEIERFLLDAGLRETALDMLRLDRHVDFRDWQVGAMKLPRQMVFAGSALPIAGVVVDGGQICGQIDSDAYGVNYQHLEEICDLGEFVRIAIHNGDPETSLTLGQTRGGVTCLAASFNYETRQFSGVPMPMRADVNADTQRYLLPGFLADGNYDHALVLPSASDFVANRVDKVLREARAACPAFQWFDPINLACPGPELVNHARIESVAQILDNWRFPNTDMGLLSDQISAAQEGINARVQLIKGPPGTGKTSTAAVTILCRVVARNHATVLVAGPTWRAANELIQRLANYAPHFRELIEAENLDLSDIHFYRASEDQPDVIDGVQDIEARSTAIPRDGIAVVAGTTNAILKCFGTQRSPSNRMREGLLVIDEASMMVFPHMLALATKVGVDGQILIVGDDRQLAPILAHDWDEEDRPPILDYQPYLSAYSAIQKLIEDHELEETQIIESPLSYTHRLPSDVREFIARVYALDGIELSGPDDRGREEETIEPWHCLWSEGIRLVLIVHGEQRSFKRNPVEVSIVQRILDAAPDDIGDGSVAIVTPHRAQKRAVAELVADNQFVDLIDTVERLQGGERPTVIVCGTESDPAAISRAESFILDLNRANVAFSRCQERLIVTCSETLLSHIPPEYESYESAMLWKALRTICSNHLYTDVIDEVEVAVYGAEVLAAS